MKFLYKIGQAQNKSMKTEKVLSFIRFLALRKKLKNEDEEIRYYHYIII